MQPSVVMAGLVPAIHVTSTPLSERKEGVDHRDEPGDDDISRIV